MRLGDGFSARDIDLATVLNLLVDAYMAGVSAIWTGESDIEDARQYAQKQLLNVRLDASAPIQKGLEADVKNNRFCEYSEPEHDQ